MSGSETKKITVYLGGKIRGNPNFIQKICIPILFSKHFDKWVDEVESAICEEFPDYEVKALWVEEGNPIVVEPKNPIVREKVFRIVWDVRSKGVY